MTIIRWGMIGCGSVTEHKSGPAYQQVEGFALHGVFNRTLAKAEHYAARHAVPHVFASAKALIHSPDIDAVYIATPPDNHEAYALKVARAGKPCCIEKPMAPDHAACLRIRDAFADQGLPLFVAYYRRSLPRFRQIKSWLDDGAIGTVRHVHWSLTKPATSFDLSDSNWRVDAAVAPGGYFDDLASHGLDLFCWLFGEVTDVAGFAINQQGRYSAADAVTGCWLHETGVTGSGSWNFGAAERQDRVEITGQHRPHYLLDLRRGTAAAIARRRNGRTRHRPPVGGPVFPRCGDARAPCRAWTTPLDRRKRGSHHLDDGSDIVAAVKRAFRFDEPPPVTDK